MSYEYEFGIRDEMPPRRRVPKGQPWCGRCHSYHDLNAGCDDGDDR